MPQTFGRIPAALAFLAIAAAAAAQIPIGSETRVDSGPTGFVVTGGPSRVTPLANGGFVVAWTVSSPAGDYDIAARRFGAAGTVVGPELLVNSYTTGRQDHPAIASTPLGDFVVVWTSDGQDGAGLGVFGQRFDASGARLGAEFQANQTTAFWQRDPTVSAWDDGFVVAWTSEPGDEIVARRFDAAGAPIGGEFQVNTFTSGSAGSPSVAFEGSGAFVVAWESLYDLDGRVRGQRFSASGARIGAEFLVDTGTSPAANPSVGRGSLGSFVVAWSREVPGDGADVMAQRFSSTGAPLGGEVRVNTFTAGRQRNAQVAVDADGDFVVVWDSALQDGDQLGVFGRRFDSAGVPGAEFRVNTYTTGDQQYPSVSIDSAGNFIVTWHTWLNAGVSAQRYAGGLMGMEMAVDASAGPASDGNRVFEAGETVVVAPFWLNADSAQATFSGAASNFTGPSGGNPTYSIVDATASYGTVLSGATITCSDCYSLAIGTPGTRPAPHWDATFREQLAMLPPAVDKTWTLHVGESFSDVPPSNGFYRFIETIFHHGVTGGCGAASYCPAAPTTREQMAVFVLVAREGSGYRPPICGFDPFGDVPLSSPFCPWISELARRGIAAGCGGGNYCPTAAVSRQEMAVFVLATKEPGVTPVACGAPMFSDVPASSGFCRWIEELARRNVVTGCGGGAYCPDAPVTREQMGVFLSGTFSLLLYGI